MMNKFANWLADHIWVVPAFTGVLIFLIGMKA